MNYVFLYLGLALCVVAVYLISQRRRERANVQEHQASIEKGLNEPAKHPERKRQIPSSAPRRRWITSITRTLST